FQGLGERQSYRSGFWGIARVGPRPAGTVLSVGLHAEFDGAADADVELAKLRIIELPGALEVRWPADGARVAICMATYNPPPDLLVRQLDSIRAQTHQNWVCVISDDRSNPAAYS